MRLSSESILHLFSNFWAKQRDNKKRLKQGCFPPMIDQIFPPQFSSNSILKNRQNIELIVLQKIT